ncbi:MAG: 4Fe-4S dicluster domain-containing protein [Desulfovibrio sp.]|jgi:NAD-dependent dihydropyrimidine dehydrogenase PreA subunit|nr:4Fe-4S dicluster domain-containing protein [Desulfovibrio sp.]
MAGKTAIVGKGCVACGECARLCPSGAVRVADGLSARVEESLCLGCGLCAKNCPTGAARLEKREGHDLPPVRRTRVIRRRLTEYLWIGEFFFVISGFCNIIFAWLGLIFLFAPLGIALFGGGKAYCNRWCGRGQLFALLGKAGFSRRSLPPAFLRSPYFRYGFLVFFLTMFGVMLHGTAQVFSGAPPDAAVTFLWTFRLPWDWADVSAFPPGAVQFAFGFYGIMITSEFLGLAVMAAFRPRSWCAFCPMGTMTRDISRLTMRR